jgi:hypothetical protein
MPLKGKAHPVKESNPARQVLEARLYPVPKAHTIAILGCYGFLSVTQIYRQVLRGIANSPKILYIAKLGKVSEGGI